MALNGISQYLSCYINADIEVSSPDVLNDRYYAKCLYTLYYFLFENVKVQSTIDYQSQVPRIIQKN